jgi:hypothetical protein
MSGSGATSCALFASAGEPSAPAPALRASKAGLWVAKSQLDGDASRLAPSLD